MYYYTMITVKISHLGTIFLLCKAKQIQKKSQNKHVLLLYFNVLIFLMALKLNILSLDTLETYSYQKCLIPKDKFPTKARPAQWAKCYFLKCGGLNHSKERNYAIAQIFPRDDIDDRVCYLDTSIIKFDGNDIQTIILENIEMLQVQRVAEKIDAICYLNTQYYVNNSSRITRSGLQKLIQTMLQKYQITNECFVRDAIFTVYGIDSLQLKISSDMDNNTCYNVTNDTLVNIKSVHLARCVNNKFCMYLDMEPFRHTREALENVMKLSRFRRSHKRCLRLSLNMLLVGAVGSGKTTLMDHLLSTNNANVFRIELTQCLKQYHGETEAELRKIVKAASDFASKFKSEDPTVILIEEIELLCPQTLKTSANNTDSLANSVRTCTQLVSLVDELHSLQTNIICLATTSKPDSINELVRRPGRFENEIAITPLQEDQRCSIVKQFLTQSMPNFELPTHILYTMARQTQGYVIADLDLLVRNIARTMLTHPEDENFELVAINALKKSKPISLKGTDVTAYRTMETFDAIGGMFHLKKILEVSVIAGLKQYEAFKRFGLSLPKGVLLYGPPGCAKTTVAKCLATEANMTFIATSAAEVYSPYVGCAEKFIAKIFQTARKNAPCLIFLDEIDSLVGRRTLLSSGDVQVRILSTLLTEMDGVVSSTADNNDHILVVAATNRPDIIDDALMRPGRFDKLIHVPAPDISSRHSILALCKQRMPFAECVDLDNIAKRTKNFSGADLCNLCNEAALQAFQRDFNANEINMQDFEAVLATTKPSLKQSQIEWYNEFENKFIK